MHPPAPEFGSYLGGELEVFAQAVRWKAYVRDRLAPHIRGRVLEVGAGLGGFTRHLASVPHAAWLCLEPDAALLRRLVQARAAGEIPSDVHGLHGTIAALDPDARFDTILYIDVLEHIEHDSAELSAAAAHLAPDGRLIVLCPAFQSVFSPFDAAIGHFRRYTRTTLLRAAGAGLRPVAAFYLDAPGLILSLANRFLLRSAAPKPAQIAFWDKRVIPLARIVDRLVAHRFGRSVVCVWTRERAPTEPERAPSSGPDRAATTGNPSA